MNDNDIGNINYFKYFFLHIAHADAVFAHTNLLQQTLVCIKLANSIILRSISVLAPDPSIRSTPQLNTTRLLPQPSVHSSGSNPATPRAFLC